jgi:hypothetical protein
MQGRFVEGVPFLQVAILSHKSEVYTLPKLFIWLLKKDAAELNRVTWIS